MTDLDLWLKYAEPEREEFEVSLQDFREQMGRESKPTEEMRAGSAFHSLLEKVKAGDELDGALSGIECGGFWFHFGDLDAALPQPHGVEEPVERVYQTPSGPVLLRGKVDGLQPVVCDYKLTFGAFDAERYADAMQWRAYLDITGGHCFRYHVFEAKLGDRRDVWVYSLHTLTFWSYPAMHAEVGRRVAELAEFVSEHVPALVSA